MTSVYTQGLSQYWKIELKLIQLTGVDMYGGGRGAEGVEEGVGGRGGVEREGDEEQEYKI